MRKLILTLVAAVAMTAAFASNGNSTPKQDIFGDDLTKIDQQFSGLNELEQVVTERNATYTELAAEGNSLLSNVSANQDLGASLIGSVAPSDRLLGIPGFLWGFCLGILGIILVYVAIDDPAAKKREGKQAIIGCAIWTVLWVLLYGFVLTSAFASGG